MIRHPPRSPQSRSSAASDFYKRQNLNRLELEVYECNERAIRCYRKAGFREEGRLRQRVYRKGKYWDVLVMAVLKEEFEREESKRNPGAKSGA